MNNILEYAGNKIDKQKIIFSDNSSLEFDNEKKLDLDILQADSKKVHYVILSYKDSYKEKLLSPAQYKKLPSKITVDDTITLVPDLSNKKNIDNTEIQELDFFANIDENKATHRLQDLDYDLYLGYIGERAGVEKIRGNGLFTNITKSGDISTKEAKEISDNYKGNICWSHIISLPTDDAKENGYDRRQAWSDLMAAKAPEIAKAYNISLENLVYFGAFHGNTDNPHIHLEFFSKSKTEGFVRGDNAMQKALRKTKSVFTNEIFKNDVSGIQKAIGLARDTINDKFKEEFTNPKQLTGAQFTQLQDISSSLPHKGKTQYMYLDKDIKIKVDDLLKDILMDNDNLYALLRNYLLSKKDYMLLYADKPQVIEKEMLKAIDKLLYPQKGDFTGLHNTIVRAAIELQYPSPDNCSFEFAKSLSNKKENKLYLSAPLNASSNMPFSSPKSIINSSEAVKSVSRKLIRALAQSLYSSAKRKDYNNTKESLNEKHTLSEKKSLKSTNKNLEENEVMR
ncbi:MAG: MobP3 family relaxase [Oscillospiraceae bacterium]